MTFKSGVTGKTVPQLQRVQPALDRQAERDARTTREQLALLDQRPGNSAKERARLTALLED